MEWNVSHEDKLNVLQAHYPRIMEELGTLADGNQLTADDVIEFFAMGIAAILDNDTNLTTPKHLRLASETAAKVIEQRTKDFRLVSDATGMSVLDVLLSGYPIGGAARKAA